MKKKNIRLIFIIIGFFVATGSVFLIRDGLKNKVELFQSPSDIDVKMSHKKQNIRLGGYVYEGSLKNLKDGSYLFKITDYNKDVTVHFKGILPDLFREGQGVYIDGYIEDGIFIARNVLAKHDATYTPPMPGQ